MENIDLYQSEELEELNEDIIDDPLDSFGETNIEDEEEDGMIEDSFDDINDF